MVKPVYDKNGNLTNNNVFDENGNKIPTNTVYLYVIIIVTQLKSKPESLWWAWKQDKSSIGSKWTSDQWKGLR